MIFSGQDRTNNTGSRDADRAFVAIPQTADLPQANRRGVTLSGDLFQMYLNEAGSNTEKRSDLFERFGSLEPRALQRFDEETQRAIVNLGISLGASERVQELLTRVTFDAAEYMQSQLAARLEGGGFQRARALVQDYNLVLSSDTLTTLCAQVAAFHTETNWIQREAIAAFLITAATTDWRQLPYDSREEMVTAVLAVEKIDAGHLLGTVLGLTDNQIRANQVAEFLHFGRPEFAASIAKHFNAPLGDIEVSSARKRLLQDTPTALEIHREAILKEYQEHGALNPGRIPELVWPDPDRDFAGLVLVDFRGKIYGGMDSGGHVFAAANFRERLVHEGFAGSPRILGGTLVAFEDEQRKITVQGTSSTYGGCSYENARQLLARRYVDSEVTINKNFPTISFANRKPADSE